MVIDKKNKAIGEWYIEGEETFVDVDISLYEHMFSKLISIFKVLDDEKLLHLDYLLLYDWIKSKQPRTPLNSQEKIVIDAKNQSFDQLKDTFLNLLQTEYQKTQAFPMMIDCFGDGLIAQANQSYFAKNLIWLSVDIIMGYVFTIRTQSDVWMPYDIKGNEQFDAYKLNAPRLEKAFKTIENHIGLEIEVDETPTKYAIPTHYGLENFINLSGQSVNMISLLDIDLL